MKVNWAKRSTSLRVCWASSRVGRRISARARERGLSSASRRCSSGSRKAAVLPLPVCAVTRRSCPSSALGMAAAWTGVGSLKDRLSSAFSRRSWRGNWLNKGDLGIARENGQVHSLTVAAPARRLYSRGTTASAGVAIGSTPGRRQASTARAAIADSFDARRPEEPGHARRARIRRRTPRTAAAESISPTGLRDHRAGVLLRLDGPGDDDLPARLDQSRVRSTRRRPGCWPARASSAW